MLASQLLDTMPYYLILTFKLLLYTPVSLHAVSEYVNT